MKIGSALILMAVLSFALAGEAEARRWRGPRGGNFWGGFAAGAFTGAVLRPPVVVAPSAPVMAPAYAPRRVWVPGTYVVRYRPCGTPYRAWRRGHFRTVY